MILGSLINYIFKYENQAYSWTSLKWGYDNLSRPSFSDVSGKVKLIKAYSIGMFSFQFIYVFRFRLFLNR